MGRNERSLFKKVRKRLKRVDMDEAEKNFDKSVRDAYKAEGSMNKIDAHKLAEQIRSGEIEKIIMPSGNEVDTSTLKYIISPSGEKIKL